MGKEFSTPLLELPSFLSTISMVGDDQNATVQKLIQAERKSPPVYDPARELFLTVLEGKLSFEKARTQASRLFDEVEKKYALQILDASEDFLRFELPARITLLPALKYLLPNGLPLNVAPVRLRHFSSGRLLILHVWQTPLTQWQVSAAAAVLRSVIHNQLSQYESNEVDFLSVSISPTAGRRQFERLNWKKLNPLSQIELNRFWDRFLTAWSRYQRQEPREIKRRRDRGLFD